MDVFTSNIARLAILGLASAFLLTGCSESSGYVTYASLPTPAVTPLPLPVSDAEAGGAVLMPVVAATVEQEDSLVEPQPVEAEPNNPALKAMPTESTAADVAKPEVATSDIVAATSDNRDSAPKIELTSAETAPESVESSVRTTGERLPTPEKLPTGPLEIKLLIPEKRFVPEGDTEAVRISYDDFDLLKVLNMDPVPTDAVDYFPKWLKDLHGKRVRLRGFMYPTFEATGLTGFLLARDNGICCFGRDPLIYDILDVALAEGETTNYIEAKAFDVEGVFQIDPEADDKELFQLYRIEDARVLK